MRQPFLELRIHFAGIGDAGEITFDVGGEDRHPEFRQPLSQDLQGDSLPVPVAPVTRPWRLSMAAAWVTVILVVPPIEMLSGVVMQNPVSRGAVG